MRQKPEMELLEDISKIKDLNERKFKVFTDSFYIIKSAIRYFAVKKGMSITASRISENFPVTVPVAGSSLSILAELNVVEERTSSSSPNRYMAKDVDMERLEELERALIENYEIRDFKG